MIPGLEKEQRLPQGPSEKKQKDNLFRTLSERELSSSHLSSCCHSKEDPDIQGVSEQPSGPGHPLRLQESTQDGAGEFQKGKPGTPG